MASFNARVRSLKIAFHKLVVYCLLSRSCVAYMDGCEGDGCMFAGGARPSLVVCCLFLYQAGRVVRGNALCVVLFGINVELL